MSRLPLLLILATALWAQDRLAGPTSGVVFDDCTRSLRWITGHPGSAYLGPAAVGNLDAASVSPNGKLVLVQQDGLLFLLDGGEPAAALPGGAAGLAHITWSKDSTAALIVSREMTLWTGLPGAPRPMVLQVPPLLAGWTAFAIEPGQQSIAAAVRGGVYRLSADEPRLLASVDDPSALALSNDGDLYVADRANRRILMLRGGVDAVQIAGEAQGVDDPAALAIAADGRSLLIANGSARSLLVIDPDTGAITNRLNLDFSPTRFEALPAGAFLLNTRSQRTTALQVLTQRGGLSVFFVPASE